MIARPSFFSAETALAFIETSVAPIVPPKTYMAIAAVQTLGARATSSRPKQQDTAKQARHRLRAVLRDEVTGPDHGADRAGAEEQDQQAERELADAEPCQEDRDLRRPASDDEAVDEEDRGDRPAAANG